MAVFSSWNPQRPDTYMENSHPLSLYLKDTISMKPTPSLLFKIATTLHLSSLDPYFFLLSTYHLLLYTMLCELISFFFLLSYFLCVSSYSQENRRFGLFHSLSFLSELSPKDQEENLCSVRLSAHGLCTDSIPMLSVIVKGLHLGHCHLKKVTMTTPRTVQATTSESLSS